MLRTVISQIRSIFIVTILALLGFVVVPCPLAIAQQAKADSSSPSASDAAAMLPAGKFVQDLSSRAMAAISNKGLSQEQRTAQYRNILHDSFDMQTIGRFVIGRSWNAASPEQQQEYMKLFEALVTKMYGDRLNFYNGENFVVKSTRPESDQDFIVTSDITHPDGSSPTTVDWRVREKNNKYAVIDVMIEGVSQSLTQRDEYSSIIQRDGGKLDGLLALMRQRLEQPSPATSSASNEE